jgi:hypothetical protein
MGYPVEIDDIHAGVLGGLVGTMAGEVRRRGSAAHWK